MLEKYLVLRDLRSAAERGGGRRDEAVRPEPEALQPQVLSLQPHERGELEDPTVYAEAPEMPVALIAPKSKSEQDVAATEPVAWGVRAVGAVESSCTGAGITVAVLDTGIRADHEAFRDPNLHLEQKDFTGEGDGDGHGHGTHCAGTIFGRDVGGTRIGVARGVTTVLIGKTLSKDGAGSTEAVVDALYWAARQRAQVITLSLGIDFPGHVQRLIEEHQCPPALATSRALEVFRKNLQFFDDIAKVVRGLVPNGVIVAAAGNASCRSQRPDFVVSVEPPRWRTASSP